MNNLYVEMIKTALIGLYIVWGFAFSLHSLLILHNNKSAIEWAKRFYTPGIFKIEAYVFFPMLYACWIMFELLPRLLNISDDIIKFDIDKIIRTPFL